VMPKKLDTKIRGSSDREVEPAPLGSEPAIRCNIIDFELAKWAMDHGRQPKRQWWHGTRESRHLPNLAAEDWFEWTALYALFAAVALFPFLAMIFFR
jgi:hypothetical protein